MIVCSCHGVPCRRIKAEVDSGARTVKEVGLRCRAGRGCGACRVQIAEILVEHGRTMTPGHEDAACPSAQVSDKSAAA